MTVNDKINEVIAVISYIMEHVPYSVIPADAQASITEWLEELEKEEV